MQVIRKILGVIGVMGCVFWVMLVGFAALFWGSKPGGSVNSPSVPERIVMAVGPMSASIYYAVLGAYEWTVKLLRAGIAVHIGLLIAVVVMFTKTDGGFLIAPFFIGTGVLWAMHVGAAGRG